MRDLEIEPRFVIQFETSLIFPLVGQEPLLLIILRGKFVLCVEKPG